MSMPFAPPARPPFEAWLSGVREPARSKVLRWVNETWQDDLPLAQAEAVGRFARLLPVERGALTAAAPPPLPFGVVQARTWAADRAAAWWAEVDAVAEVAVEAAEARLVDLDGRYEPDHPVWRALLLQALRARDRLASVSWLAAAARRTAAWRAALVHLDARGARLAAGALDLEPVEDELLAELGAGLPAWWLAPALVGAPALGAAQDVSPTPHVVLRLPARVPAPAEALRLAADDAEPDGSGGRVVARLAGVTVRFDEAARTLVLTAGLGVELRLDDPEVVAVLDLRTGAAAPLAITVRKPTLWIARLPGEGRFELRVGAAVMRLDTVEA